MKSQKNWLSEAVTQKFLGCKRGKLWKLRKEGKIDYSKLGGQTFYFYPSIERLLFSNSTLDAKTINSLEIADHE